MYLIMRTTVQALTLYKLDKILNGDIQEIIDACIAADQAKKLSNMEHDA